MVEQPIEADSAFMLMGVVIQQDPSSRRNIIRFSDEEEATLRGTDDSTWSVEAEDDIITIEEFARARSHIRSSREDWDNVFAYMHPSQFEHLHGEVRGISRLDPSVAAENLSRPVVEEEEVDELLRPRRLIMPEPERFTVNFDPGRFMPQPIITPGVRYEALGSNAGEWHVDEDMNAEFVERIPPMTDERSSVDRLMDERIMYEQEVVRLPQAGHLILKGSLRFIGYVVRKSVENYNHEEDAGQGFRIAKQLRLDLFEALRQWVKSQYEMAKRETLR